MAKTHFRHYTLTVGQLRALTGFQFADRLDADPAFVAVECLPSGEFVDKGDMYDGKEGHAFWGSLSLAQTRILCALCTPDD